MSAVSTNVIPSARAASTTARAPSRSRRRPKLLHPRPTRETSRPLGPSSCVRTTAFCPVRVTCRVRDLRDRLGKRARRPRAAGGGGGGARPPPGRVARWGAPRAHGGRASEGALGDGPVGLAARRLAIIDLETGDQPIANEDGTIHVVQNGEVYNSRELRAELERSGHRFRTHGDTEVLVHLYEQHGLDFARRLRGMFTVALWDSRERRLVLARDRYGIKPLYYRPVGGSLEFASELRALPRGEIDLDALEAFLAFNSIPAPLTIFRDTRKLSAGHLLVWENGKTRTERFARPRPALELRHDDEAELIEELRARLRDSVRAHLVSDVPVGVLLSGGIDSSALTALAAEESAEPVRT